MEFFGLMHLMNRIKEKSPELGKRTFYNLYN